MEKSSQLGVDVAAWEGEGGSAGDLPQRSAQGAGLRRVRNRGEHREGWRGEGEEGKESKGREEGEEGRGGGRVGKEEGVRRGRKERLIVA